MKEIRKSEISINDRAEIREWISNHQTASYKDFMKETKDKYILTPGNYHYLKSTIDNKPRKKPIAKKRPLNRNKPFMVVWQHPAQDITEEAKNLLLDFITSLTNGTRANFELIEVKIPEIDSSGKTTWADYLEVREN